MTNLNRRNFLQLGAAGAGLTVLGNELLQAQEEQKPEEKTSGLLEEGDIDISARTGKQLESVLSHCFQCPACCGIRGYLEDGRVVKIEANLVHPNNRGRICARGQSGANQVYDPDRILYPLKRTGARGSGTWKRISWDDAYQEISGRLSAIRQKGHPEELVFHYGDTRSADMVERFGHAFGTPHILKSWLPMETNKAMGLKLTWGQAPDVPDVLNTRYILNFGSDMYSSHILYTSFAQRVVDARTLNGAKLVTFDPLLSNTAGRSDEWFPLKPGAEGIVALAMANYIMQEGLYDKEFLEKWTNYPVDKLVEYLQQYSADKAEEISGCDAYAIERIAKEFAYAKPAVAISGRGAYLHRNGVYTERCIALLNAVTGNIDNRGGLCLPRVIEFAQPDPVPPQPQFKNTLGHPDEFPLAWEQVPEQVFPMIKAGKQKVSAYIAYWHNPAYSHPDTNLVKAVLKNENLLPFFVAIDAYMTETAVLADIILPDTTYLERWDPESRPAMDINAYVGFRQPVIKPLGGSVPFREMCVELAKRIGDGMEQYFNYGSPEDYLKAMFNKTKGIKESGGFDKIKESTVWYSDVPDYKSYAKELTAEELDDTQVDPDNGVITKTIDGKKETRGIMMNGKAYHGFKTASGKFQIYSKELAEKGFNPLPAYEPIPDHQALKDEELVLLTFEWNVHTGSRTANCKWLAEIVHDNPVWINPETAAKHGIRDGDSVKVTSKLGSLVSKARVTEGVHPKTIAISTNCGHEEYGRIAQAKKFKSDDPDTNLIWWGKDGAGVNPNSIIPIMPDPIGGGQAWNDTVVTVTKIT